MNKDLELSKTRAALVELLQKIDALGGLLLVDATSIKTWNNEIDDLYDAVEEANKVIAYYG